ARGVRLLVAVLDAEGARVAEACGAEGVIARGLEAGGWIGEETTFILLQRLVSGTRLPVWAHGGVGLHTAAACHAAGAAGVVVDLQLALTRESSIPEGARTAIARMDGSETVCLGEELGAPVRVFTRPGLRALEELRRIAKDLRDDTRPRAERLAEWRAAVRARVS